MRWAIAEGNSKRIRYRKTEKDLRQELSRRFDEKQQMKQEKERRRIEKVLKTTDIKDLKRLLPEVMEKSISDKEKAISDIKDVILDAAVGRSIRHRWYENEEEIFYMGKLEEIIERGKKYVVSYWKEDETYQDAIDFEIPKFLLAADIVFGDLIIS